MTSDPDDAAYPGGAGRGAYRLAFDMWAVLFLAVLCAGLLNYLGTYAKQYWPNL